MSEGHAITASDRNRLKRLVTTHGEAGAGKLLGVPRHTLARALAGLGVRTVTRELLRLRLDEMERTSQIDK